MQRPFSDSYSATSTVETTNTMGHTYRTPSPIREPYKSSSNVNSPQTAPETYTNHPHEYTSYQQRIDIRASRIASAESDKQYQRHTAALACVENVFDAESDTINRKPGSTGTVTVSSDHVEGVPLPQEPCTPKKKRVPLLWHGLPSPETPSFRDATRDTPSAGSAKEELVSQNSLQRSKDAIETVLERANDLVAPLRLLKQSRTDIEDVDVDDVKIAIPQTVDMTTQNDVRLTRGLEESLSPPKTRRSARLRTKPNPTYTNQTPVAVPKTARKPVSPPVVSESCALPESSIVPVKADPVPFEGLPTVHSLSWQLQFPPGGSTHPSYPYPAMDPRLIFHQAFVPIIGGLPDVKLVSKLTLPMGWKHISWSGLLPIAFDPYHQAFKLTPVGPMPLTCEEVRQGGLHKYVPGGKLHPEYGMLPEMIQLSDGSDGEVFDFDGVDWTLPWEGQMDFHAPSPKALIKCEKGLYSPLSSPFAFAPAAPSYYNEAWDCPDGIIDLSDAWRWLSERETKPTAGFIASPGKVWKGTGIHRVSRRLKQPIASLMSTTIANLVSNPTELYLANQDNREFDAFKSVATPVHVDITLLGDVEFSMKELLCYFPCHYYWRKAADRIVKAGITGGDVANMINFTRKLEGEAARKSGAITGNLLYETSEDGVRVKIVRSGDEKLGYTAQGWSYNLWELTDYPLLALAHGLLALPSGQDAGPLTKMIIWCRDQGRHCTMLSEVPALLEEAGIEKIQQPETGCPDQIFFLGHSEALREDRKRVMASEKLLKRKRELESKEETRGRRKKTE